jgi:hypothetical protein
VDRVDNMNKEELISEIVKLEMEVMSAISNGHKAHDNDEFKLHRQLLKAYRNILFGNEKK